jgi:hypothetical protein
MIWRCAACGAANVPRHWLENVLLSEQAGESARLDRRRVTPLVRARPVSCTVSCVADDQPEP